MPKTTTTPERTLAAFTLVSRPRWLWLAILLLATLSLLTYGLLGAIPRTVNGIGVTRDGNRLIPVASSESGIVEEMLVEVGQAVAAGEAVGKLVSDVLAVEIDSAERRLGLLRSEDERASAAESATMRDAERRLDSTTREASDEIRSSEELWPCGNGFSASRRSAGGGLRRRGDRAPDPDHGRGLDPASSPPGRGSSRRNSNSGIPPRP